MGLSDSVLACLPVVRVLKHEEALNIEARAGAARRDLEGTLGPV